MRIVALGAALLVLAGCGGSASLYTLGKTRACLRDKNVRLGPPIDFVATTATGGATRALLGGNAVSIVFGETQSDADNIADEYQRVAASNVGISDILQEQRNAVLLWRVHPTDADVGLVTGCLK
jgi:hypothetical protein